MIFMAVNKVRLSNGETLIDISDDTVTPETLAEGVTAHDASGERIVGTMSLLNNHDITLGVHTDGLLYIFVDGVPTGNGVSFPSQLGDVYGNVDSGNNIVLQGALADGTYSVKYEMEDGKTVNIGNLVLDTNVYYSITKNLTECTISNNATQAIGGKSYTATITANDGYELKSVTVTMGGSAVSVTNGVINIANVTGNIVITAEATEVEDEPTNFAGAIVVGRLGSDGTIRNDAPICRVTDFAAVQNGDIVRLDGIECARTPAYPSAVYNSSKSKLSSVALANGNTEYYTVDSTTDTGAQITIISNDVAFVRFSGKPKVEDNNIIVNVKRNGSWL